MDAHRPARGEYPAIVLYSATGAMALAGAADTMEIVVGYAAGNTAAYGVMIQLRGRTQIDDYRGIASARPLLSAVPATALPTLVGIPPLGRVRGQS